MELPFDILDHIFSFLKSHPKALFACSKAHPVISLIVEKYRFHHIIIHTGHTAFTHSFTPSKLLKRLVKAPQIVNYVAVLQIEFNYCRSDRMTTHLEEIASLLPMFPVLECIMLTTSTRSALPQWQTDLPQGFRAAVEKCLCLPTLQEVHVGNMFFPLSILDHTNINYLSLSGPPQIEDYLETAHPQIKSLALEGFHPRWIEEFSTWAKRHILGLQSLKYNFSCHEIFLRVFEICSDTLENLYLCLQREGTPREAELIDLSFLPRLRHLTIHTEMFSRYDNIHHIVRTSFLPTIVKILKTASSLQQLTIEIYVDLSLPADPNKIDLSPLEFLTESSVCYRHIDLFIFTASPWSQHLVNRTILGSLIAKHGGLVQLIEKGLVVHLEEAAPILSRSYIAKEADDTCIIM